VDDDENRLQEPQPRSEISDQVHRPVESALCTPRDDRPRQRRKVSSCRVSVPRAGSAWLILVATSVLLFGCDQASPVSGERTPFSTSTAASAEPKPSATVRPPEPLPTSFALEPTQSIAELQAVEQLYMEAVAGGDVMMLTNNASWMAAPQSPAQAYALHQANYAEALLGVGFSPPTYDLRPIDGGWNLCGRDGGACLAYTDWVFDNGLVSTFSIATESIDGRVRVSSAQATVFDGGDITALTVYQRLTGLSVTLRLENTSDQEIQIYWSSSAVYITEDGVEHEFASVYRAQHMYAGSNAVVEVEFESGSVGGYIEVQMCRNGGSGCDDDVVDLVIRT
jgi:hypothetical protein